MTCRLTAFLALVLACVVPQAQAAMFHDPTLEWYTASSAHFRVHYHNGLAALAPRVLGIAEAVRTRIDNFLAWNPDGLTDIVLTDEADEANGAATPYPYRQIVIYVTAPDMADALEDNGGWLQEVITHEYLHIVHLDMVSGVPAGLQDVFGRFFLLFPNLFEPFWMIEGLATYAETDDKAGIGRGQGSYFAMLMRGELVGGLKPLRQVNQPVSDWPIGMSRYLYGVYFERFIAERYGKATLARLAHNNATHLIPYRINGNTKAVLGKDLDTLWAEFTAYLHQRFPDPGNHHPGERLTDSGGLTGPAILDVQGRLVYQMNDLRRRPGLYRLDPDSGQARRLADVTSGVRLASGPAGSVLLAELVPCRTADLYSDLYRVGADGTLHRLSRCGRYRHAVWLAGGQRIIAVHNAAGVNSLELLDATARPQRELWRGDEGEVIGALAAAPNGASVVATRWNRRRGWDLAQFDLASGRWRWLTDGRGIEMAPSFAPDGKAVYFTADYTGRYALYRLRLSDGSIEALGADDAFDPQVDPSGRWLYYRGYGPKGFDLYRVALASLHPQAFRPPPGDSGLARFAAGAPTPAVSPKPYTPWATLAPTWWFPHLNVDDDRSEVGLVTAGSDALMRHSFALDFAYDGKRNWPVGSLDYLYDRGRLSWHLSLSDSYAYYHDNTGSLSRIDRSNAVLGETILPMVGRGYGASVRLGLVSEGEQTARHFSGATFKTRHDTLGGLGLSYDSTYLALRATGPEDGWRGRFYVERHGVSGADDYRGWVTHGRLAHYGALGPGTLELDMNTGWGEAGSKPFRLGGTAPTDPIATLGLGNLTGSALGEREVPLRGYPSGLAALQGRKLLRVGIQYVQPLLDIERGLMAPPIALDRVHGGLFAETGAAWDDSHAVGRFHPAVGAELYTDLYAFYAMKLRLTIGLAKGFDKLGEKQLYIQLGGAL